MCITHKGTKFVWSDECNQSLQLLKNKLTSAPILALPTTKMGFMVYSDASQNGLMYVLM